MKALQLQWQINGVGYYLSGPGRRPKSDLEDVMARGLIAVRMSDEELALLDSIMVMQGDANRSACLRSLVTQTAGLFGIAQDDIPGFEEVEDES